jgi:prephenate dehydratase
MINKLKIGIQGDLGSNHHLMLAKLFEDKLETVEIVEEEWFTDQAEHLDSGELDLALMAIENSIAGSILENYDLFTKNNFWIIGEGYLRIKHDLIGLERANLDDINVVYSHPMALNQCEEFLRKHNIEQREYHDTAAAVPYVLEVGDKSIAAIAPALAQKEYGGKVLTESIETDPENYTRFVLLCRDEDKHKYKAVVKQHSDETETNLENKTMLELTLAHSQGSLGHVLTLLEKFEFNLTKIESRPIIGESWHYRFYLDFLADETEANIMKNVDELSAKEEVDNLRLLGICPRGKTFYQ